MLLPVLYNPAVLFLEMLVVFALFYQQILAPILTGVEAIKKGTGNSGGTKVFVAVMKFALLVLFIFSSVNDRWIMLSIGLNVGIGLYLAQYVALGVARALYVPNIGTTNGAFWQEVTAKKALFFSILFFLGTYVTWLVFVRLLTEMVPQIGQIWISTQALF